LPRRQSSVSSLLKGDRQIPILSIQGSSQGCMGVYRSESMLLLGRPCDCNGIQIITHLGRTWIDEPFSLSFAGMR